MARGRRVLPISPLVLDGLDDKAKGGADGVDILAHYPFHNGGLAGIVEAPRDSMSGYRATTGLFRLTASGSGAPCPSAELFEELRA